MDEFVVLLRSTLQTYATAARRAGLALRSHWLWLFSPLLYLLILTICGSVVGLFGPYAASFLTGILSSLCFAHYCLGVRAAVRGERVLREEHLPETGNLFLLLLSSFFLLFVFSLVQRAVIPGAVEWIHRAIGLLLLVFLNPLVEVALFEERRGLDALSRSVEFVGENIAEWFVPQVLFFLVLSLSIGGGVIHVLSAASPESIPSLVVSLVALMLGAVNLHGGWLALVITYLLLSASTLFVMVFRGALFELLRTTSRRKRIYQSRYK